MKKLLTILVTLSLSKGILSQNVGVGTTTPSQKLDVAGNINTTGNLMVNGAAGTNGQVLTMNGSTMQWMDKSRFKNWSIYFAQTSPNFIVPAGVTEVLIEMWGAGGGGHNPGGGGGSGGYWIGLIPVTAGSSITVSIGLPGTGGSGNVTAGNGGSTSFSCTGFNVSTGGGEGADTLDVSTETYIAGAGGEGMLLGGIIPIGFRNYFFIDGNSGSPTEKTYIQTSSGVFDVLRKGGIGGVAPFSGQSPKPATYHLQSSLQNIRSTFSINRAGFASGGTPLIANVGASGGFGRLIIYY